MSQAQRDAGQYAAKVLDQLRELDATVHGAYYDMGRLLSSILHGKLYELLGYSSMASLIEEELSFSSSQAFKYLHTYRHLRRLGYNKAESLDLIYEFSFSHLSRCVPNLKEKVGKRAIRNAIEKQLAQARQINFTLNETEHQLLIAALEAHGAEYQEGRLMYSSMALVDIVKEVLDLKE